jgi:predicted transcriptional regulator
MPKELFGIKLDPHMRKSLDLLAEASGMTLAQYVRKCLYDHVVTQVPNLATDRWLADNRRKSNADTQ